MITRPRSLEAHKRLAAASCAAVSLLVAACGGNGPTSTEPSDVTESDPTTPDTTPRDVPADDSAPDDSVPTKLDGGTRKPDALTSADAASRAAPAPTAAVDAGTKTLPSATRSDGGEASAADAGPATSTRKTTSCLDGITDYENAGPFKFETKSAGAIKLWIPTVPAGCKVPVIHLANGTTANCGDYQNAIERMATHGFLTTCYEDPNTGAGTYGIMAFEAALSMYPDLADNKLGSTGHSQGGQAALVTLALAEAKWGDKMIYTGLAMEPASGFGTQPTGGTWQSYYGKVKSPVFMFSGDSSTGYANSSLLGMSTGDGLVAITWVNEGFAALSKSIEAYHWTAVGATHIPTPEEPEQQISIPWFRWKLLGDSKACAFFKQMSDGTKWKMQKEQNAMACP